MRNHGCKGSVTVFMSLLLLVLLSFIGSVIVASRAQISKAYSRGNMDVAMNSIFAEYQVELLEEFGIFALESTYESGTYDVDQVIERLEFYGAEGMEIEVEAVQLLTDNGASAYQEQIVYYMEQKYGLDTIASYLGITDLWTSQESEGLSVEQKIEAEEAELAEEVAQAETTLDVEENPLNNIATLRGTSILNLVIEDTTQISQVTIDSDESVSSRVLQTGTGTYSKGDSSIDANQLLLGEYMLEQFSYAEFSAENNDNASFDAESDENSLLKYELEYILEGNDSDIKNLESVVHKIILIRTGVNYTCLSTSVTKKAEADAMALAIATAAGVPYLQSVIKESLLLAWAYAESVVEVKSLLYGGSLDLVKLEADWNLELSNLLTFGEESIQTSQKEGGMSYKDYLRMLIYLENSDNLVMRSLDLVEQRVQVALEQEYFQVDYCISKLEIVCSSEVIDGYSYEFPAYYAYQ